MKLYIPACGDRLTLVEDWQFLLHLEHRNLKFARARNLVSTSRDWNVWEGEPYRSSLKKIPVDIKKGSVLEVDRVYIRQHSKSAAGVSDDFDSVTWKVVGEKNARFWTKLEDCNTIEFELAEGWRYKDRKAAR